MIPQSSPTPPPREPAALQPYQAEVQGAPAAITGNASGPIRHCKECGNPIANKAAGTSGKQASSYCSRACSRKFNRRRARNGVALWDLAGTWRRYRTKGSFSAFVHQLDILLRQDREDGRQSFIDLRGKPSPFLIPSADPIAANDDGRAA